MIDDSLRVLGLESGSDTAQVRAAYRRLAQAWHPDRNRAPDAAARFAAISAAYRRWRDAHDGPVRISETGRAGQGAHAPAHKSLPVSRRVHRLVPHPAGSTITVLLSYREQVRGFRCTFEEGDGSGNRLGGRLYEIHVGPGAQDGQTVPLDVPGTGLALDITVRLARHPLFRRLGDDLVLQVPTHAGRTPRRIPLLDRVQPADDGALHLPLCLLGEGLARSDGSRGDLIATLREDTAEAVAQFETAVRSHELALRYG